MTAVAFAQPAAGQHRPPVEGIAGQITTMVTDDVKHAAAHAPRSLQRAPGPSELGTPCTRRLAYKAIGQDPVNNDTDPWASIQGTSVHAWMAATYDVKNRAARRDRGDHVSTPTPADRYLVEHRIHLPYNISGSSDLFDRETGTVIDWKLTSLKNIAGYRKNGPGAQYRAQAHLYGLGLVLAGEHVEHVADVFLPRGGRITDLHVWTEPFDPAIAAEALARYNTTTLALAALNPVDSPERWAMFPTAESHCVFCPYHLPMSSDLGRGCPGHKAAASTATSTTQEK